jgi:hypothetical protein
VFVVIRLLFLSISNDRDVQIEFPHIVIEGVFTVAASDIEWFAIAVRTVLQAL